MTKLLYSISSISKYVNGIALLPGIPVGHLDFEEIKEVGHSTMLEFRMPNSERRNAEIVNYFVEIDESLRDPKSLS